MIGIFIDMDVLFLLWPPLLDFGRLTFDSWSVDRLRSKVLIFGFSLVKVPGLPVDLLDFMVRRASVLVGLSGLRLIGEPGIFVLESDADFFIYVYSIIILHYNIILILLEQFKI